MIGIIPEGAPRERGGSSLHERQAMAEWGRRGEEGVLGCFLDAKDWVL